MPGRVSFPTLKPLLPVLIDSEGIESRPFIYLEGRLFKRKHFCTRMYYIASADLLSKSSRVVNAHDELRGSKGS